MAPQQERMKPASSGQRLLWCHACLQTPVVGVAADACSFKPFHQMRGVLTDGDFCRWAANSWSLVVVLFNTCCPSAVLRLVVPVVVDAVDRVRVARSSPHVFEEAFVGSLPAFTDTDPTRAVVLEELVFRVRATRQHVRPGTVLRRLFAVGAFTVSERQHCTDCTPTLTPVAATRGACSVSQERSSQHLFNPTVTATAPLCLAACCGAVAFHSQPSAKTLAQNVRWFHAVTA